MVSTGGASKGGQGNVPNGLGLGAKEHIRPGIQEGREDLRLISPAANVYKAVLGNDQRFT